MSYPRRCATCRHKLDTLDAATRIAECEGYNKNVGRIRYWVCPRCWRLLDRVIVEMREREQSRAG